MPGRGPPPKDAGQRVRSASAARGEWMVRPEVGWRHGPAPRPPSGLQKASRDVWAIWFGSWFAAHWEPEDLPGLFLVIRLYDSALKGELQRMGELRLQMDTYGMTPKGQQDRRWRRPPEAEGEAAAPAARGRGAYGHLRSVPAKPKRTRKAAEGS